MTSAKSSSPLTSVCNPIVFFGSSEFSLPTLEFLLTSFEKLTVITTPDRPQGRGLKLQPNPVKERSEKAGIHTLSPAKLRDPELEKKVVDLRPDCFVVASYGKMIPESWLKIPSKAAFNLHPSLLPKYRGAAPIPWQILEGEKETGVSVAEVTKDLDAGDLFHQIRIPLSGKETTESLTKKLADLARRAIEEVFLMMAKQSLNRIRQDHSKSTYARKLTKEDGCLNLALSSAELERKVRAFHPWPGTFIAYEGKPLRIMETEVESIACAEAVPGALLEIHPQGFLRIQTGKGALKVFKVQLPGRRVVSAQEFANGERLKPGIVFQNLSASK